MRRMRALLHRYFKHSSISPEQESSTERIETSSLWFVASFRIQYGRSRSSLGARAMNRNKANIFLAVALALSLVGRAHPVHAQDSGASLSGKVTDASGAPLPNVAVVARNLETGELKQAQTDAYGGYNIANLAPGDFEGSAPPGNSGSGITKITLTAETQSSANLTISPGSQTAPATPPAAPVNLPNAPSSSKTEP